MISKIEDYIKNKEHTAYKQGNKTTLFFDEDGRSRQKEIKLLNTNYPYNSFFFNFDNLINPTISFRIVDNDCSWREPELEAQIESELKASEEDIFLYYEMKEKYEEQQKLELQKKKERIDKTEQEFAEYQRLKKKFEI